MTNEKQSSQLKRFGVLISLFCAQLIFVSSSSWTQSTVPSLEAIDPEFNQLIDRNASFDKLPIDFPSNPAVRVSFGKFEHFTEGPLWDPQGFLLFSDIYGDRIYKWKTPGPVTTFRDNAGFPNGLTFDQVGRLLICNQKLRRLERVELNGKITVLADGWEGKKLNAPNDVVVRKDGTIYFTDPFWKFPPGAVQELAFQAIWRVSPDGKLSIAAQDFGLPNGIAFSPDEKSLYLGDTSRKKLYQFDVAVDGTLSGRKLLADLTSSETGAVDGMKIDKRGDIFTTGPGGVWVFDRTGKHLGTIRAPAIPANLAWGDPDYRTLYLATPNAIYRLRTKVEGLVTYKTSSK
jgi:sugar lactone lactonase YvrE